MLDRSAEAYRPALARAFAGTRPRVLSPQGRFSDGAALLDARLPRGSRAQSSSQYCIAWTRVIEHIPPAATPSTFPMAQTLEEFDLVAAATTPVVGLLVHSEGFTKPLDFRGWQVAPLSGFSS
jgi:hypothetical protein